MSQVCDYLKANEKASWEWFSSVEAQSDYADSLRMELLKTTYRLGKEDHAELYESGQEVLDKLELEIPLTIYQSQVKGEASAALYYLPGEAHVVFFGNILELLTAAELKSILAHELAHYKIWQENEHEFLIADRYLNATVGHPQAENSHLETARRFRLFTEIYADRGSLYVLEDLDTVICALIKVHTGMKQVSSVNYLEQANEIFSKEKVQTEGLSHPEAFIRARALLYYKRQSERLEDELNKMILGELETDSLDLIQQSLLTHLTSEFIKEILSPHWLKDNENFTNRLKLYSDPDFIFEGVITSDEFFKQNKNEDVADYFSYVLIDFVALDREMMPALALHCYDIAQKFGIHESFESKLLKELKIKKTDWKSWLKNKSDILAEVQNGEAK